MFELRSKLTAGHLADFTSALRDQKPSNFDGNVMALPEVELAIVVVAAAKQAGWYEAGQAPTTEQLRSMDLDDLLDAGEAAVALWQKWAQRQRVDDEEKKV